MPILFYIFQLFRRQVAQKVALLRRFCEFLGYQPCLPFATFLGRLVRFQIEVAPSRFPPCDLA